LYNATLGRMYFSKKKKHYKFKLSNIHQVLLKEACGKIRNHFYFDTYCHFKVSKIILLLINNINQID